MSEYIVRETGFPGAVKQEVVGEVVRCKECAIRYTSCPMVVRSGGMFAFFTKDDDYCSYGVAKGESDGLHYQQTGGD